MRAALLRLLPAPGRVLVAIRVRGDAAALSIDFNWPGQSQPDTRELSVGTDCQIRAEQVALIVAAWLGDPPVERLAGPVFEAVRSPPEILSSVPPVRLPPRRQTTLGVGVLASAGGGWASGLRVDLARTPIEGGFGWGASVVATTPRQVTLDAGVSRWSVISVAPVLKARRPVGWVDLELDGGPLVGLAIGWGAGYDVNSSDTAVVWGLCGDLRLLARGRPFQPWIDLRGVAWPYPPRLRTDTTSDTGPSLARLPSADIQIAIGMNVIIP